MNNAPELKEKEQRGSHLSPALWRNVPYAWLWAGQTVSRFGTAITTVAFPLLVLELAPSAQMVGTASALITLGNVLLTPVGGILSDRGDPRRLMMAVDWARFVFIGSLPLAFALGRISLPHLYVVAFLVGSGRAVFDVAHSALLPRLVARKQLAEANSGLWTSFSVAQTLGRSFCGFLVAALGAAYAMGLDAVSFLVSAASLLGVRPKPPDGDRPNAQPQPTPCRSVVGDLREGLAFLWQQHIIRNTTLLLFLFHALCLYPALALLAYRAKVELGLSKETIGLVFAAGGVGSILGSLAAGLFRRWLRFGQVMVGCLLVSALGLGLLALGTSAVPVGAGYGLLHGAWIAALLSRVALRQSLTPLPLQGRVGAAERFIAMAGGPLGAYLGGIIGDRFGAGPVFAAGAALAVVLAAGGWCTGLREA